MQNLNNKATLEDVFHQSSNTTKNKPVTLEPYEADHTILHIHQHL